MTLSYVKVKITIMQSYKKRISKENRRNSLQSFKTKQKNRNHFLSIVKQTLKEKKGSRRLIIKN